METRAVIPPRVFAAVDSLNISELSSLRESELRPLLPSLVRMSLCSPLDQGKVWTRKRRSILRLLCGVETVNSLVALLSIDFHVLEQDAKKELALRGKAGGATQLKDSNLISASGSGSSALEFERSEAVGKLRLVLSEILFVMSKLRAAAAEAQFVAASGGDPSSSLSPNGIEEFYWRNSELFEDGIYLEEVSDVLCIAQAELPNLLQITELADTLLHVPNGDWLICRLVANNADAFHEVCHYLVAGAKNCGVAGAIVSGDSVCEDDVDTRKRCQVLGALIAMNPNQALSIRAMAVNDGKLPELAIALTLKHRLGSSPSSSSSSSSSSSLHLPNDLLEFSSGLLLNSDVNARGWFAHFVRNDQKKKSGSGIYDSFSSQMVREFRADLLRQLALVLGTSEIGSGEEDSARSPSSVVYLTDDDRLSSANSFVRLYCALKAASIKFTDDESTALVILLTSRPSASALGTRFISLSLSMIIACPGLFSNPEDDRRVSAWLQWLTNEAPRFESKGEVGGGGLSGGSGSSGGGVSGGGFGEMLLLIAIHFHGNQMTAISDLVCATLGMKVPVRSNSLVRLKTIFTQEIFSERVVTSLAVSVPVTKGLSAAIPGFLSVHCIHQLLKSRAFAKHKVPIKDWICRQLKECRGPLHPVVPPLVEAFVNSTLIPSRQAAQNTNEPLSQQEVMTFFASSPLLLKSDDKMEIDDIKDGDNDDDVLDDDRQVVPQILVLYYLLLYEDVRMSQIKATASGSRQFVNYSSELWDELPIKYLLRLAHRDQQNFAGLYASLLKLVANHFPHLCLVDDWLTEEEDSTNQRLPDAATWTVNAVVPGLPIWTKTLSPQSLQKAFDVCFESKIWTILTVLLTRLSTKDSCAMIPFAETLTSNLCRLLPVQSAVGKIDSQPPRKILDIINAIWLKLSSVMPRHLHVMTVNGLRSSRIRSSSSSASSSSSTLSGRTSPAPWSLEPLLNQSDIITDPLTVLRCDERVFRSPPLLDVTLHILNACLHASKAMLAKHIRVHPSAAPPDTPRPVVTGGSPQEGPSDGERDELRFALIAAQDSAAVQILLEWCLPLPSEESGPLLSSVREVQCLVCSWLHQMFIADPTLVKLIHFQGYPLELLRVTVAGVPSMHICIDFIPELLRQPQIEKQVFAIQLVSFLSLQYPLPRTLSVARLCINVMATLLAVLPRHQRIPFFLITTPSLSRISRAFPPLAEDVTSLLLQLGRICNASTAKCSYMAAGLMSSIPDTTSDADLREAVKSAHSPKNSTLNVIKSEEQRPSFSTLDAAEVGLMDVIKEVFESVVDVAALLNQN